MLTTGRSFVVFVAVAAAIVIGITFMRLTTITVVKSSYQLQDSLRGRLLGQNMLLLNISKLEETIIKTNPHYEQVRISKQIPGTLTITITRAHELAQLETKQHELLTLSGRGKILAISPTSRASLPIVAYYGDIPAYMNRLGSRVTLQEITYALRSIQKLQQLKEKPAHIAITAPQLMELQLEQNEPVYLLTMAKNVDKNSQLVHNMKTVLEKQGITAARVDMRYDKPILINGQTDGPNSNY